MKESWAGASSYERAICEKTLMLKEGPKESFSEQVNVTVALALLVEWAARSNIIAVQVLSLLLTGGFGDRGACTTIQNRLASIRKGVAKYLDKPKTMYSIPSVRKRLECAFWLPPGGRS